MKVDITDFEVSQLAALGVSAAESDHSTGHWSQLIGVTLLLNDEPAFIMGVCPVHTGVYDVVMVPGPLFYSNVKTCIRHIKLWLEGIRIHLNWHRLQVTAEMSEPKYARFLQKLGFKEEGILRRYSPGGQDVVMLAMAKEE